MGDRFLLISILVCGLAGCGGAGPDVTPTATAPQGTDETEACPGESNTHRGRVTVTGRISTTKGAQLFINDPVHGGIILPTPEAGRRAWVEKQARITGDLCVHSCDPRAQCLLSGRIKYLRNAVFHPLAQDIKP